MVKINGKNREHLTDLNVPHLREKIKKTCANRPVSCVNGENPSKRMSFDSPKGRGFFLKKLREDPVYRTLPLLYSCQNKKTQEGTGMKDVELRYVGGHVEVYTEAGAFLFSADTLREAMEELDAA